MAEKEYIEREALLNEIEEKRPLNWTDTEAEITEQLDYDIFENLVKSQPTADVQEVRHGNWEQCFEDCRKQIEGDKCSVCNFEHYGTSIRHYHYCPNCGAKMDKE